MAEVTRSLAKADPIGLISDGCPDDEDQAEAEELLRSKKALTPEMVQGTFFLWFGAQISEQKARDIAESVIQIRQQ